jgi:hypothetical protein
MIVMCKSLVDTYKDLYKKEKMKNNLNELLVESLDKRIKKLEKENEAYKILLKKELNEESK